MALIVDALQIGLLAVIALELFFFRRDLYTLYRRSFPESRKNTPKGQTINVNVGTPIVQSEPKVQNQVLELKDAQEDATLEEGKEASGEEEKKVEKQPSDRRIVQRQSTGGLSIVKCSSCGMENTSFRTECFNCGVPL